MLLFSPYLEYCFIIVDGIKEDAEKDVSENVVPPPPPRPLFSWGSDNEQSENEQEINATAEEVPLNDEIRVVRLMPTFVQPRYITKVRTGKIRSATEVEEEEKKRSQEDKSK